MEIVIEYVLIDNLVINFLILYLSALVLKAKPGGLRLCASSSLGAICALITPILNLPNYLLILYKLLLGLVMVRIGLGPNGFKKNLVCYFVFILVTAAIGGICFGIVFMLSGNLSSGFVTIYNAEIPVGIILLLVGLVSFGIAKTIKYLNKRKLFNTFIFKAEITNKEKSVKFEAYLDSGNTLIDPISKKPVVIIDFSVFKKLVDVPFEKVITRNIGSSDIKNSYYIDYGTVLGEGKMLVFEVEKLVLNLKNENKIFENVVVGLAFSKFQKCFNCQALLGPELAKEFII